MQWFVNIKPLADKAKDAVKTEKIKIIPERNRILKLEYKKVII